MNALLRVYNDEALRESCRRSDVLLRDALKKAGHALNDTAYEKDHAAVREAVAAAVEAEKASRAIRNKCEAENERLKVQTALAQAKTYSLSAAETALKVEIDRLKAATGRLLFVVSRYTPQYNGAKSIMAFVELIGEANGYTAKQVLSPSKSHTLSLVRQEIMYEAKETGGFSTVEIGKALGRDHSTVGHGVRKHRARIEKCISE